ncbi:MAG: sterol desaturase family protein [Thiotrichaceae bacterium]|nr:sterol desaturase family protein [Thiotrichaceae bacterium]
MLKEQKIKFGEGIISGIIALVLSAMSLLGALAFYFPDYLTTPDLRKTYSVEFIRQLMFYALIIAGGLATFNIARGLHYHGIKSRKYLGILSWILISSTLLLGANTIEVGSLEGGKPYIGLDWFILDLLGSSLIFITIEKIWPFRDQPVFRFGWQTDFNHFLLNHLLIGLMLLVTTQFIHHAFGWVSTIGIAPLLQSMPFLLQLFFIILFADLVQYWAHRGYHEVPFLWRFHAVHHSAKRMDWMAGSRQHILEIIATRCLVLVPVMMLGFSKSVVDAYIIIVGLQAVFNHANVQFKFGWLQYIIVTPQFHHWHHSSDKAAIDKNYAAHFSFLDYLFGSAVKGQKEWPKEYGVVGDYIPEGLWKQQLFPFKKAKK